MWSGLDLIFPPTCGGCGRLGARWCETCQQNIVPLPEPICEVCGEPQNTSGICSECAASRPPYRALRSWVVFKNPIQNALHKLKYRRDMGLGDALAPSLAKFVDALAWDIDTLVPIPLSQQRFSERGYNQVALIAQPLALLNSWQYAPKALRRTKHTRSQVGLSARERQGNVQGVFAASHQLVKDKSVLVVDDVSTTGATLASASQALMEAGAKQVYALTVAKALSRYGLDTVLNTPFRPLR
jgi:competence protein ComFC